MKFVRTIAIGVIWLEILFSLTALFIALSFNWGTMITASIPRPPWEWVSLSTLLLIGLPLAALASNTSYYRALLMFWIVCIAFMLGLFEEVWSHLWQRYIFQTPGQNYTKAVTISRISREGTRGGPRYYAYVNPYRIQTIDPSVSINENLYNKLSQMNGIQGSQQPVIRHPKCYIRVFINRVGSAERIMQQAPLTTNDLSRCDLSGKPNNESP